MGTNAVWRLSTILATQTFMKWLIMKRTVVVRLILDCHCNYNANVISCLYYKRINFLIIKVSLKGHIKIIIYCSICYMKKIIHYNKGTKTIISLLKNTNCGM